MEQKDYTGPGKSFRKHYSYVVWLFTHWFARFIDVKGVFQHQVTARFKRLKDLKTLQVYYTDKVFLLIKTKTFFSIWCGKKYIHFTYFLIKYIRKRIAFKVSVHSRYSQAALEAVCIPARVVCVRVATLAVNRVKKASISKCWNEEDVSSLSYVFHGWYKVAFSLANSIFKPRHHLPAEQLFCWVNGDDA